MHELVKRPEDTGFLPIGFSNQTARLVDAFLSGRNERTLKAYNADLRDFQAFTHLSSLAAAADRLLSGGHGEANALALAYKTSLMDRGLQTSTVNRRLASLRSLSQHIPRVLAA